jgi:hypothetical protein
MLTLQTQSKWSVIIKVVMLNLRLHFKWNFGAVQLILTSIDLEQLCWREEIIGERRMDVLMEDEVIGAGSNN